METVAVLLADPEDKTPVGGGGTVYNGAVQKARRNQQKIAGVYPALGISQLDADVSLEKKVEFIVIMRMEGYWL